MSFSYALFFCFLPIGVCCILPICFGLVVGCLFLLIYPFSVPLPMKKKFVTEGALELNINCCFLGNLRSIVTRWFFSRRFDIYHV